MIRNYLKSILLVFIATITFSCEKTIELEEEYGTVTGYVRDALTNDPIAGANITTSPASTAVVTDEEGFFKIENVSLGDLTVTSKKLYYKSASVNLKVFANKETQTVIIMEASSGYDDPVGKVFEPYPSNKTTNLAVSDTLRWRFELEGNADSIKYNVKLFKSPGTDPVIEFTNIRDTFAIVEAFNYNTTYYWQVTALADGMELTKSELWSFSTREFPDNPFLFARKVNENFDIYSVLDSAGKDLVKLTDHSANIDWYPRVNRITGRIAFISNRNISPQIYTMDEQGGNIQKVTSLSVTGNYNQGTGFCWSPDGSKLLYPHYDKLYVINADGTGLREIATAPAGHNFTACDWANYTGKIIVQTTGVNPYDNELWIMDADGSNLNLFYDDLPGMIQNPVFSADGLNVMFTHDVSGLNAFDGRQLDARIFIKAVNDTTLTDISLSYKTDGTNDLMPRFSPDGSQIIFVNTNNVPGSKHTIMICNLDGSNRFELIEDATMPEWR